MSKKSGKKGILQIKAVPRNHVCTAALIVREGKILMGLREYKKGKPLWTFPGGRCDFSEKPAEALRREVVEEIGVTDLEIIKLLGKKKGAWTSPEGITDEVFMYECTIQQKPKLMEPEKFLEWRWVDINNLPENLIDSGDRHFVAMLK